MKKLNKYLPIAALLQILPFMAAGQGFTLDTILSILQRILGWFTAIVGIFAILMILYAAFLFLTSAGNEERVGTAKKTLLYGVIGIAVAILAYVAVGFISNLVGVSSRI